MADGRLLADGITHPVESGHSKRGLPVVRAIAHVKRMKGGSQAHLMRCSDGWFYVVKFANNPQGTRILANELLAQRIATFLGLPVPPCAIVDVGAKLIELTEELVIDLPKHRVQCQPGLAFGSRYVGQEGNRCLSTAWDLLPLELLSSVNNLADFRGMLVFDKWTCNTDGRQVVFRKKLGRYDAHMIDNGYCFNAESWSFPDAPLRGLYGNKTVYRGATNIQFYEPWLARIEDDLNPAVMQKLANQIPPEWYQCDRQNLEFLLHILDRRRGRVRELVLEALQLLSDRFPQLVLPTQDLQAGLCLKAGAH